MYILDQVKKISVVKVLKYPLVFIMKGIRDCFRSKPNPMRLKIDSQRADSRRSGSCRRKCWPSTFGAASADRNNIYTFILKFFHLNRDAQVKRTLKMMNG